MTASSFPVPASLQDLERPPYNLLPYPAGFDDDDEAARASSFDELALLVERGNRTLVGGSMAGLFADAEGEDGFEEWNDEDRVQALYTLVRKSSSLAPGTRKRLISALCQAVQALSSMLDSFSGADAAGPSSDAAGGTAPEGGEASRGQSQSQSQSQGAAAAAGKVAPQSFRDALACHLYMLFSVMHLIESEAKIGKSLAAPPTATKKKGRGGGKKQSAAAKAAAKKEAERRAEAAEAAASRESCASAMLSAARSMCRHRSRLWRRGVPDEDAVNLPCRIAYQMLESATGVVARRACSADAALGMIAAAVDSSESLMGTIVAALVDLLHSYEHMAPLVSELCCLVSEEPTNRLAVELLREIGRLETSGAADAGGKASGIKFVAPFISELASQRPQIVLTNISLVLPHLDSEPYQLRSAIVAAIGNILVKLNRSESDGELPPSPASEHSGATEDTGNTDATEGMPRARSTKSRNALLDILTQRAYDTSSYTRAAVLKAWGNVTESEALPLERVLPVTALAIGRLQDKAVMVRRAAMQLLTLLLENNPFMGSLDPVPYIEKVKELEEFLKKNIPSEISAAKDAQQEDLENNEEMDGVAKEEIEAAALAAAIAEAESTGDSDNLSESEIEFYSKVKALKFASSALDFIGLFENSNDAFEGMLLSSNASDVTEALRFFVRARHFQLPSAVTGMKRALALMWSTETSIQDEVLKAFVDVFIAVPGTDGGDLLPRNEIADNLLVLVGQATVSERASIEEAVARLVKQDRIPSEVFMLLWTIASKSFGDVRAAALIALSMGASADPTIVDSASRLRLLADIGLGEYAEEKRDWSTVKSAAFALQQIPRTEVDPTSARFLVLEHITDRLSAVAQGDWCNDASIADTQSWFSAAEQAINAIFVVWPEPEHACADIIRVLESSTFGVGSGDKKSSCSSLRLARFFFVIGHIALKLLVYTENLSGAVRRANAAKTLAKQESADKAKAKKKSSGSQKSDSEESDGDDAMEAELGLAQEAEAETERQVAEISEKEIVGRGLIGAFGPLLVRVVGNEGGLFSSEILMQSSTLALCKLMCISSSFCEKHLPLLFTALANAPSEDTTLRANTVVALGDLAFRFPNAVEPYTPRLYACLRDKSTRVRRHTLMVLTHLILNDMVKVKGQVCEIALCLQDNEARIRDMARLLFFELSKRSNNPIYNLLPDIVSQLSQMGIRKEDFRSIMSFLLGFIKKDKQTEMLVDKLCQRFQKCTSISQKADLAFCLSQLKVNDKCIKCLNDHFKLYKDALFDEDVFKSFSLIVSKAKKFAKPEMKDQMSEWEQKLKECSAAGLENHLADTKAASAKRRAAKRAARKKKVEYEGETDEEESSNDEETENDENACPKGSSQNSVKPVKQTPARGRSRRTRRGRA